MQNSSMRQTAATQMDEAAIRSAYRRWAPVYDNTFGRFTTEGRRHAVEIINQRQGKVLEVGVERDAVQKLHRVVVTAVGEPREREDIDDVAVADLIHRPRFGGKPRDHAVIGCPPPTKDLDRDALTDHRMDRAIDRAEPAATDLVLDDVLANLLARPQHGFELGS